MTLRLTDSQFVFLSRFVSRGWLHAVRDDPMEQAAIHIGLRKRWLRRELNEAHFTVKGRRALAEDTGEAGRE